LFLSGCPPQCHRGGLAGNSLVDYPEVPADLSRCFVRVGLEARGPQ
jgi:hypothetical protein